MLSRAEVRLDDATKLAEVNSKSRPFREGLRQLHLIDDRCWTRRIPICRFTIIALEELATFRMLASRDYGHQCDCRRAREHYASSSEVGVHPFRTLVREIVGCVHMKASDKVLVIRGEPQCVA
jgi:hypothetical protein